MSASAQSRATGPWWKEPTRDQWYAYTAAWLGWTLDGLGQPPDLVIVELGANDMLRGLDPALTETNLDAILTELERRKIKVLVAGMRAAPNLDPAYRARFDSIFARLAARHRAAFYPFFLDGVAAVRGMQQGDGMHPTYAGIKVMATRMVEPVRAALPRR